METPENSEEIEGLMQYYHVLVKKFFSCLCKDVTWELAIVQNLEVLSMPKEHVLKSWHLKKIPNSYSIMEISNFAKSCHFVPNFLDKDTEFFFCKLFC